MTTLHPLVIKKKLLKEILTEKQHSPKCKKEEWESKAEAHTTPKLYLGYIFNKGVKDKKIPKNVYDEINNILLSY